MNIRTIGICTLVALVATLVFSCTPKRENRGAKNGQSGQVGAPDPHAEFMDAVFRNDIDFVKCALEEGMSCNFRTDAGLSPVQLAASASYDAMTLLLLEHGAEVGSGFPQLAISNGLVATYKLLEQRGSQAKGELNPLLVALQSGALDEMVDYLIPKFESRAGGPFGDACFRSLAYAPKYPAFRKRKAAIAHKLLDAGLLPAVGNYFRFEGWYLEDCFEEYGDTALVRRLMQGTYTCEKIMLLNRNVVRAKTLASVDSLLTLGADPLVMIRYQENGSHTLLATLKEWPSALSWQKIKVMLERDPKRIDPELSSTDRFFIDVCTGRCAAVRKVLATPKGRRDVLNTVAFGCGKSALDFAAETGDTAMLHLLLDVPFSDKQREQALRTAVNEGMSESVRILLENWDTSQMDSLEFGRIILRNLYLMYGVGDHREAKPLDSAIAGHLLDVYHQTTEEQNLLVPPFSANQIFVHQLHGNHNKALSAYILNRYAFAPSPDTLLFANCGRYFDFLLDPDLSGMVSTSGFEALILSRLCKTTVENSSGYCWTDTHENVLLLIERLNLLLASGIQLDAQLKDGWYTRIGSYQIGFNRATRKFELVW